MKTRLMMFVAVIALFVFNGCSDSKESYVKDFKKFIEKVEAAGSDYTAGLQGNCTKITINNLLSAAFQTTIYFFRITGHLFLRFSSLPWHVETSQLFKWTSSPSIDYQNLLFSWLYSNPALFSFWTSISFWRCISSHSSSREE